MIVDKLNIVKMEMLLNMKKQLAKARGLLNSSTVVFDSLPIVIIIKDFYQFPSITRHPLWGKS